MKKLVFIIFSFLPITLYSQGNTPELFSYSNYNLEDTTNQLTIEDVITKEISQRFDSAIASKNTMVKNTNSTYWIRFKVRNPENKKLILITSFLFEDAKLYIPLGNKKYIEKKIGLYYSFWERELQITNPAFILPEVAFPDEHYFIQLKSKIDIGLYFQIFTLDAFFNRNIREYLCYGVFFGIVVIIGFYNLVLFFIIKEKVYVFYGMYILSLLAYSIVNWGFLKVIASDVPFSWQYYFWTIPFCAMTIFLLFYTKSFLNTKNTLPFLNRILNIFIIARVLILIVSVAFDIKALYEPIIDISFLITSFIAGIISLKRGFMPAKYFLLGFSIIFFGFLVHTFLASHSILAFFSITNSGIIELFFFSVALADRFNVLKKEGEVANQKVIEQLKENEVLKDQVNQELEVKVAERTKELKLANEKLEAQAYEIERMNLLLKEDNKHLQNDVKKLSKDRVMKKGVSFEEFLQIYPDEEACYKYLEELKWSKGYQCRKCGHNKYSAGKLPYSRKCSKCNYIETITAGTIFSGVKFSLVKAFYIVFLYSWGKELTVDKMATMLDLRRNTGWAFKKKVAEVKKAFSNEKKGDILTQLILNESNVEDSFK